MLLGYNTNGFPFHRLDDVLVVLADLGYGAVGLTLDHSVLDPFGEDLPARRRSVRRRLEALELKCVVETGARFVLDPLRKHQPTLLSPRPEERRRRIDFLRVAMETAVELETDVVSFWSGSAVDAAPPAELWERLERSLDVVLVDAERLGVRMALEPEPEMFVASVALGEELIRRVPHPKLGLTFDVGHAFCVQESPLPELIRRAAAKTWNVHVEDMNAGVHHHLMFGDGQIDFPPLWQALHDVGYAEGVYVELSAHGAEAVEAAKASIAFLRRLEANLRAS